MRIPGRVDPRRLLGRRQGFSLPELLVAMVMAGIVIGAVYTTYKSQQGSYVVQDQVVEMQQNLRAAIFMMASDIRMAGYNPTGVPNLAGFVADLPAPNNGQGAATNAAKLAVTMDAGNGTNNGNGVIDNDNSEQTAYRLDPTGPRLQRFSAATKTWVTVADDIEQLNFVYLDGNGNVLDLTDPTNLMNIRRVEVTMVARTRRTDREFRNSDTFTNQRGTWNFTAPGDNYRRRLITTTVVCRNMGL
ncbi:MAG TPA: prepilin-type N-terminal cleavage/methylation domain-containing protein [archaeon]|nr:prepilin-type N-terminal cleavage/methylation domain-containing protein [archaeon]